MGNVVSYCEPEEVCARDARLALDTCVGPMTTNAFIPHEKGAL